jgi:hypothetical protein
VCDSGDGSGSIVGVRSQKKQTARVEKKGKGVKSQTLGRRTVKKEGVQPAALSVGPTT